MSSKFFWCWIPSHQVTTPTFNHQREQSWNYEPNAQSSEHHRFQLSLCKFIWPWIRTPLTNIKLLIVMIYPMVMNNDSTAGIIFYCRSSNVFDRGCCLRPCWGLMAFTLYANFSKIQKILNLENHLAPAVLDNGLWIRVMILKKTRNLN